MGVPSIFIRFGGCNLTCTGFSTQITSPKDNSKLIGCDSIRAVNKKHFISQWRQLDAYKDLLQEINSYDTKAKDLVFTGGEPLLHYENQIFYEALEFLIKDGYRITIETNATMDIDFEKYPIYKKVIFAMSPKLSISGESESKRLNIEAINNINKNTTYSFLKIVLNEKHIKKLDMELKNILDKINKIDVYCMALSSNMEELNTNAIFVAQYAIQNSFRYSDRLQVRLWNNKDKA